MMTNSAETLHELTVTDLNGIRYTDDEEIMFVRHLLGKELEALIASQIDDVSRFYGYIENEVRRVAPFIGNVEMKDVVGLSQCIAQIVAEAAYRLGLQARHKNSESIVNL